MLTAVFFKWAVAQENPYTEQYRPQLHFSPKTSWMNDPNGMVFYKDKYHLFYQYHPHSTLWGPMHWGHAVSTDLVNWEELPIALFPDALGTIFSGSAVIDKDNTAGFGANAMVAIYTNHSHEIEREKLFDTYETQGIAYSLDEGKIWTKYRGNPVLPNPGIKDFRDPKVMWYEPTKKWIMTLATMDHITFYSSPDLKNWAKESEFGKEIGAHGGVWECPDLFSLTHDGKQVWVLIVNLNPGGPNKGSATQYFTGVFDGKVFMPDETEVKWLDYGPDEYAGITWSNTGDRKVFIGWMSNWMYAGAVPTKSWRSACTVVRDIGLTKVGNSYRVTSVPVKELDAQVTKTTNFKNTKVKKFDLSAKGGLLFSPAILKLNAEELKSFSVELSNKVGERLLVGFDKTNNQYFIDRSQSGKTDFHKEFAGKSVAPRLTSAKSFDMTLVIDKTSVELFADGGLSVMTAIFFPQQDYTDIKILSAEQLKFQSIQLDHLKSIWEGKAGK